MLPNVRRLNNSQLSRLSEILENIAVAWFSAGVISPLFLKPSNLGEFLIFLLSGLGMAAVFGVTSINLRNLDRIICLDHKNDCAKAIEAAQNNKRRVARHDDH